jgi:hypothetical protein
LQDERAVHESQPELDVTRCTLRFYEKVVKVKADVAAILTFLPFDPRDRGSRLSIWTQPQPHPSGGCARGSFRGARGNPSGGGSRGSDGPALLTGARRASGLGGTRPPRLSPGGGNGKGGDPTSLPQATRGGPAPRAGTRSVLLSPLPLFSPFRSPTSRSISRSPFQMSGRHHPPLPCFYPHSSWAARGPVLVGVRSKAQVHHHDGPGLLGAAIWKGDL